MKLSEDRDSCNYEGDRDRITIGFYLNNILRDGRVIEKWLEQKMYTLIIKMYKKTGAALECF